ncbi:MAG TPA: hypothetical protein VFW44_20365 [Bryobacteraceae bacterium]|nr:hypothetical protein [Bryobacteraceae bacterium]
MKWCVFCLLLFTLPAISTGQTVIGAVTDAASFAPRVAPGQLASIFGSNLADSTQQAGGFPLPQTLGGAQVFINNAPVPLLYASQSQINFQVPSGLSAGTASMYITRGGGRSAVFQFAVVSNSPGIFQDTSNHAIAQNADNSTNSDSAPAAAGDVIVVYLTGQGAVDHPVADGTPTPDSPLANATGTPTATIGGMSATVQFLGLAPGFAGLAQANIVVPALATADYPLVITVGGYMSASAMISVSGSGIAPPTFLTLAGQVAFANDTASNIAVYGNTVYLCGPNQINVVDITSVTAPVYAGFFGNDQLAGNGGKCAVNLNASVPILVDIVGPGTAPSFAVYNIEAPQNPILISQQSTAPYTFLADISFLGTVGYFSTSWFQTGAGSITGQFGNFVAFDFSNLFPALLSVLSTGPGSGGGNLMPNALALNQSANYPNTAYIASTTATGNNTQGVASLDIVNINDPSSLQGVNQFTDSNAAIFLGFGYDNDLLLITGNTTSVQNPGFDITGNLTLTTANITNVNAPSGIADVQTDVATMGTYVVQPFLENTNLFAIVNQPPSTDPTGPDSLMIVDATTPSKPVLYPFLTQFGMNDVATAKGYLLVPSVTGVALYALQTP